MVLSFRYKYGGKSDYFSCGNTNDAKISNLFLLFQTGLVPEQEGQVPQAREPALQDRPSALHGRVIPVADRRRGRGRDGRRRRGSFVFGAAAADVIGSSGSVEVRKRNLNFV